ncbi:hypothetical protein [Streptomyces sp. MRC013]|uniref:hypothetical protein n=1 Tax=Streptomyces sp. MRC013 TaxID=2898276 RepID=UPI0032EA13FB
MTYLLVEREGAPAGGRALTGGEATADTAAPVDDDGMPLVPGAGPTASANGRPSAARRPSGTDGPTASPSRATAAPGAPSGPAGGPAPGPGGSDRTGGGPAGGTGGTTGGGSSSTGGVAREPACHPIGDGKYNCTVWRTADSHRGDGSRAGVLNAGTNYFYCQSDLGRRETHGEWTNVWWAKTDDDSGNTGVWFSDVYIRGGDNDAPVPGLPLC